MTRREEISRSATEILDAYCPFGYCSHSCSGRKGRDFNAVYGQIVELLAECRMDSVDVK